MAGGSPPDPGPCARRARGHADRGRCPRSVRAPLSVRDIRARLAAGLCYITQASTAQPRILLVCITTHASLAEGKTAGGGRTGGPAAANARAAPRRSAHPRPPKGGHRAPAARRRWRRRPTAAAATPSAPQARRICVARMGARASVRGGEWQARTRSHCDYRTSTLCQIHEHIRHLYF